MNAVESYKLLIFSNDENHYAFHVEEIERVMRIVDVTPVADAPFSLLGVFNLHGKTLPVISLRRLFSLNEKKIGLEDILLISSLGKRSIALLADAVLGVYDCKRDETSNAEESFLGLVPKEIAQWGDTLIPVIDMEKMINAEIFKHV